MVLVYPVAFWNPVNQGGGGATDPYWNNVAILMPLNNNFNDVKGKTVLTTGNPTIDPNINYFGTGSLRTDQGSFVYINPTNDINFGDGDFTIEAFVRLTSLEQTNLIDFRYGTSYKPTIYFVNGAIRYFDDVDRIVSGNILSVNTWYYIACTRLNGDVRLFVNANQVGAPSFRGLYTIPCGVSIGNTSGFSPAANIEQFRLTLGVARDVSSVPTAPFPVS